MHRMIRSTSSDQEKKFQQLYHTIVEKDIY
jgi:hypothetical protein